MMSGPMSEDSFVIHRSLLFTVAYQMLGSAVDAEDVVQETWLRWVEVDRHEVRDPRAFLVRIATRKALDLLRSQRRRREEYVGAWLPEPLLTTPDVAEDVELAESVSIAMLTVLETLGPVDRAVFILREVFEVPYDEIAGAVGKTPEAVRQIAHRARKHVSSRRPRMKASPAEQEAAVRSFLAALQSGDLQGLLDVLAPDVVAVADGGGLVPAVARPVEGADRVARLLIGLARVAPTARLDATWLNGAPAVRAELDGKLDTVVSLTVEGGSITGVYAIRNPQKLARLGDAVRLDRIPRVPEDRLS